VLGLADVVGIGPNTEIWRVPPLLPLEAIRGYMRCRQ